jgi:hypothetical protein
MVNKTRELVAPDLLLNPAKQAKSKANKQASKPAKWIGLDWIMFGKLDWMGLGLATQP